MMPFFNVLLSIGLFWILARVVTKDKNLDFWTCALWILGAWFIGWVVHAGLGQGGLQLEQPIPVIGRIIAQMGALAAILFFRSGFSASQIWTIIGLYSGVPIVLFSIIERLA